MNRREFLQGVAAIGAAALLPKVDVPEPQWEASDAWTWSSAPPMSPSGFDELIAECPTRPMTYADLEKGIEMLRKGWPDPFEMNKLYVFDPPLEIGHTSYAVRDNFGISASRIQAAIERHMREDDLA